MIIKERRVPRWRRIIGTIFVIIVLIIGFFLLQTILDFGKSIVDSVVEFAKVEYASIQAAHATAVAEEARLEELVNLPPSTMVVATAQPTPEATATPMPQVNLTVAFESLGQHLPIVEIAQSAEEYRISLLPLNFNDQNEYSSEQLAEMLHMGEIDVLFAGIQFLPRFGNVGKIIFPIAESSGADKLVAWNSSMTRSETVAVVENSRGHFLVLTFMRMNDMSINSVEFVLTSSEEEAIQFFLQKEVDAVAVREPYGSRALLAGGTTIISTDEIPVILDVAIASTSALEEKRTTIQEFVTDWYFVSKIMQDHPDDIADTIASWRYERHATNGWTRVYRDTATSDLQKSLQRHDFVTLEDAIVTIENRTPLVDKLQDAYSIYVWSGAHPPDFHASDAIVPEFVLELSER